MRVQRRRENGWRMPPNTLYVGRGSVWGNPFIVGKPSGVFPAPMGRHGKAETMIPALSLEQCLEFYRDMIRGFLTPEMYPAGHNWRELHRYAYLPRLRGKNLMCWCAIISHGNYQPCHADVLLSIANNVPMEEVIRENIRRAEGEALR